MATETQRGADRFRQWVSGLCPGGCTLRYHRRSAPVVSSYADAHSRQLIARVGSLGLVEFAVRENSAARLLGAKRRDTVELQLPR